MRHDRSQTSAIFARDAIRRQASLLLAGAMMSGWLLGSCGGSSEAHSAQGLSSQIPKPAPIASSSGAGELLNWPEFGLNPQRSDASESATGITPGNLRDLKRITVHLPGTVDSSPIYLHDVTVDRRAQDALLLTTTYGKTIALDPSSGKALWTFTPPGYSGWAGTPQITVASPVADPEAGYVYAASPNGLIHKLSLSNGQEASGWPVRITLNPSHQKITAALNVDGPYLVASTGGYIGDIPPYQGHVVLIDRGSGDLVSVFNTLCANRRTLFDPSTCSASDSAILSRAGTVVEPGGKSIIFDTGNGPWNGRTNFGDSVIELAVPSLRLRQAFTPRDQEKLNTSDLDLGSSAPALLGHDRVALAGKDGIIRVLSLSRLDGHPPGGKQRLGGEVQTLPLPGGGMLFSAPAVWRHGGDTTMFIGDEHATAAYVLKHGRLRQAWESPIPGTSPILAGGLLYVYDPDEGGIEVYQPRSPHPIAKLPGGAGHWNSPIVVDGHVIEPEGDANEHKLSGTLSIFSAR
jgi:hypothetical protein